MSASCRGEHVSGESGSSTQGHNLPSTTREGALSVSPQRLHQVGRVGSCSQRPCTDRCRLALEDGPAVWPVTPHTKRPALRPGRETFPNNNPGPSVHPAPPHLVTPERTLVGPTQEAPRFQSMPMGTVYSVTNPMISRTPLSTHVSHNIVRGGCHGTLQCDQSHASSC